MTKDKTDNHNDTETDSYTTISSVLNLKKDDRPHLTVEIAGTPVRGLLDSGASCTILGNGSEEILQKCGLKTYISKFTIKTADGTTHNIDKCAEIPFNVQGESRVIKTLIAPSIPKQLILGIDFWQAFGIWPAKDDAILQCNTFDMEVTVDKTTNQKHILTDEQQAKLNTFLKLFESPKTETETLTCTHVLEHRIDTGDAIGIRSRARPTSPYIQKEMDEEIERMLRIGVIEPAKPTDWAHPVACVRKPNGKLRFCLDARRLNDVTVKDTYPLPYINRILGQLTGTKYISCLDLSDAFWQIRLDERDKHKTAFIVPGRGLFQYCRMPFGLCNASQTLARLMDMVLNVDLEPKVFVYLDDIIVTSDSFAEHLTLLEKVAKRLRSANLTISLEKSRFCLKQVEFLGYLLNENGLSANPKKVQAIVDLAPPKSVKDTRRLLGLAGWYRRFIPNFSSITAPISELLKNPKAKFNWTDRAEEAFSKLKAILVSAPVLCNPNFGKMFTIQTDASDIGLGAVLTQEDEGVERVIAYMSQKLTSTQKKYSASERECLAVITAIEKFRPYVEGVPFRVITDCASLIWLKNLKNPTSRLARWSLKLQEYEFELLHRKGQLNVVPDILSRAIELVDSVNVELGHDDVNDYENLIDVVKKFPEKYPNFKIHDSTLFKYVRVRNSIGNFENEWRIYAPKCLVPEILKRCHDDPTAAHLGFYKTLKRIQETYYWPKMISDIKNYVKQCEVCQVTKSSTTVTKVPMGEQKAPTKPWEMIAVDYLGPYPRSRSGNKYLLIVLDIFSKFCLIEPMRAAEHKSLRKFLEDKVFLMFGVPKIIISDNGKQFTCKYTTEFLESYNVKQFLNPYYHPQNNPSERVNRVILSAIRSYINPDQKDWDENISKIACALRTAEHKSAKFTPFEINFGSKMVIDHETTDKLDEANNKSAIDNTDRSIVFDRVKQNLKEAYDKYSQRYNLRTREISFSPSEIVLKKKFKQSNATEGYNAKLDDVYETCRISKKLGSCTYAVEDMKGKFVGNFHANDLRKFTKAHSS